MPALVFFFCPFHYDEIFSNKQDCIVQTKRRKKERVWHKYSSCLTSSSATQPALSPGESQSQGKCTEKLSKKLSKKKKKKSGAIKMGNLGIYLSCSSTIGPSNICVIYIVQLKTKQKNC